MQQLKQQQRGMYALEMNILTVQRLIDWKVFVQINYYCIGTYDFELPKKNQTDIIINTLMTIKVIWELENVQLHKPKLVLGWWKIQKFLYDWKRQLFEKKIQKQQLCLLFLYHGEKTAHHCIESGCWDKKNFLCLK